jgi:four helix bundle protein
VWDRARELARAAYRHTAGFPAEERFTLTAQIREAAVSIPANIAEGAGRATRPDYSRFLAMAGGSLNELESHLIIAGDLGFGDAAENRRLGGEISQIRAMLTALATKVAPPRSRPTKT